MVYHFNSIESELLSTTEIRLTAEDETNEVLGVAKISIQQLKEWYPKEFEANRMVKKSYLDSEPEYEPAGYDLTLSEWYEENLFRRTSRRWSIWNKIPIDKIEIITP